MSTRLLFSILMLTLAAYGQASPALVTVPARTTGVAATFSADGVVEAVRQTVLAAQVSGAIVELRVKAGDRVKAGQVLVRIDARAAVQSASASQAQAQAARASLDVAAKDFDRQKLLSQKGFISPAARDQAEAVYKAAAAQVNAQLAQAGAARSQSDFFVVHAPYDGLVAEVPVVQGDMAMPGRALVTIYDPAALRVTVAIPQTATASASAWQAAKVELPGNTPASIVPSKVTLLPTADPATHTQQLRLDLPAGTANVAPGMFARAWLPLQGSTEITRVYVSPSSIVRRAEMVGVYVVDSSGKPSLRQVRLGRQAGDSIEVLTGLNAGELVASDPQAAAKVR